MARYLAPALGDAGWAVTLVAGSLGEAGEETHAGTFFGGLDVQALDYSDAVRAFEAGGSAIAAPVPMHPSFEDREGVPDVLLAAVDPSLAEHLAAVWAAPFEAAGADGGDRVPPPPPHAAARRRGPPLARGPRGRPPPRHRAEADRGDRVRADLAATLGTTLAGMPDALASGVLDTADLDGGQRALVTYDAVGGVAARRFWAAEPPRQATAADHLIAVSPPDRATAIEVLGVEPERVTALPNGVDIEHFRPRALSPGERRARFRRWLVEDPQGWDDLGRAGQRPVPGVRPRPRWTDDATVLVFVGRFTRPSGCRCSCARSPGPGPVRPPRVAADLGWPPRRVGGRAPGGRSSGGRRATGIYFAGWRGHDDLPDGLAACDVLVMPSVNDPYPQIPLEAMAAGLPVLATLSGGFPSMVNLDPARPTGWLVPPDDIEALADALVDVLDHTGEVTRAARTPSSTPDGTCRGTASCPDSRRGMPAPPSTPPAAGDVDDATTGRRPATAVQPVAVDDGPIQSPSTAVPASRGRHTALCAGVQGPPSAVGRATGRHAGRRARAR